MYYYAASNYNGFIFNGSTYTILPSGGAVPLSISGNIVIGDNYGGGSFIYNIATSNYSLLNVPSQMGAQTRAISISGNLITGWYVPNGGGTRDSLYNMSTSTFSTISPPGSTSTSVVGVSGNYVRLSLFASGRGGFLINIATGAVNRTNVAPSGSTFAQPSGR